MPARYAYGVHRIHIRDTALPCPGVALHFRAVVDYNPREARIPLLTILNNLSPRPRGGGTAAAPQVAKRFTRDTTGDFCALISQLQRVEAMVVAAGLPPKCAPFVNGFLYVSLSRAAYSLYTTVVVTVEAGDPGSIRDAAGDEREGDKEEEVPPGADAGECAICYGEYLVGGAATVGLACGHAFHRSCIDRWTAVKRTCPYCRAPVPWPWVGQAPSVSGSTTLIS
ncbi:unnamed protein product [Urochloa humidicola]